MSLSKPIILSQVMVAIALLICVSGQVRAQDNPTPSPTFSTIPLTLTVQGTVISGTAGISVPPGLQITLQIAHPGKNGVPSQSVKQDTALGLDNTFKFTNVLASPGDIALVTTTFQDLLQGSPPIQLANDQKTLNIPLTLYAITTDASVISLLRVQHILDFKQGVVQILATYDYKNSGDKLYVSQVKAANELPVSVYVPLPIGAQSVAFNEPSVLSIGGSVNQPIVQDLKPLVPGQNHDIIFSYQLPYSPGIPVDQDYPYNTSALDVLIPDDTNISLSGVHLDTTPVPDDQIVKGANSAIDANRNYAQYTFKSPIKAGDRLVYFLGGRVSEPVVKTVPVAAPTSNGPNIGPIILIVLIIFFVILIAVIAIQQSRRRQR